MPAVESVGIRGIQPGRLTVGARDLELLPDLGEVAASNNTNDALFAQLSEQLVMLGRDLLTRRRECSVNVKEA